MNDQLGGWWLVTNRVTTPSRCHLALLSSNIVTQARADAVMCHLEYMNNRLATNDAHRPLVLDCPVVVLVISNRDTNNPGRKERRSDEPKARRKRETIFVRPNWAVIPTADYQMWYQSGTQAITHEHTQKRETKWWK